MRIRIIIIIMKIMIIVIIYEPETPFYYARGLCFGTDPTYYVSHRVPTGGCGDGSGRDALTVIKGLI